MFWNVLDPFVQTIWEYIFGSCSALDHFDHSISVSAQGLTSMCLCMKNSLGRMLSFACFFEYYRIAIEDTEGSSLGNVGHCPCTLLQGLSQTSWLYIHTGSWVADSGWGKALFDVFLSLVVTCCASRTSLRQAFCRQNQTLGQRVAVNQSTQLTMKDHDKPFRPFPFLCRSLPRHWFAIPLSFAGHSFVIWSPVCHMFMFAIPLSLICHLFAIWLSFVCQPFVICSYVQYVLFLCQLFIPLSFVFDLLAIPLSSLCHFCCFFLIPLSFLVLLFPFACDFRCWGQVQGNVRSLWQLVVGRNHLCICMPVRAIQMSTGVVEFQNKVEVPAAILISASKDVHRCAKMCSISRIWNHCTLSHGHRSSNLRRWQSSSCCPSKFRLRMNHHSKCHIFSTKLLEKVFSLPDFFILFPWSL